MKKMIAVIATILLVVLVACSTYSRDEKPKKKGETPPALSAPPPNATMMVQVLFDTTSYINLRNYLANLPTSANAGPIYNRLIDTNYVKIVFVKNN